MIICCGEALIDMMPRHIDGEGDAFLPIAGGAGFNTAIALGRLGEKTGFVSGISTDLAAGLSPEQRVELKEGERVVVHQHRAIARPHRNLGHGETLL